MDTTSKYSFQIYSEYDGYSVKAVDLETNSVKHKFHWSHDDFEDGVGGEKAFGLMLERLGFHVYYEEVC